MTIKPTLPDADARSDNVGAAHAAAQPRTVGDCWQRPCRICPGVRERDLRLCGMCLICAHQWAKNPTEAIEPLARKDAREVWACPNWESLGVDIDKVHEGRA